MEVFKKKIKKYYEEVDHLAYWFLWKSIKW